MGLSELVQYAAALLSVVLLVMGFRKNDRKILLAAWICLLISLVSGDFIEGFTEGFEAASEIEQL